VRKGKLVAALAVYIVSHYNHLHRYHITHKSFPAPESPTMSSFYFPFSPKDSKMFLYEDPRLHYFSRQISARMPTLRIDEQHWIGIKSPWAWLWACVFALVPICYTYIALVLLRESCHWFPPNYLYDPIHYYLPWMARFLDQWYSQKKGLWVIFVELWCGLEVLFYLGFKLQIRHLQTRDPLEASLSAAPLMSLQQRRLLWERMMESTADDPIGQLEGWFFDQSIHTLSQYDVRDFFAWSMYEGRHQEHLTFAEQEQLDDFMRETEVRISLHLYGARDGVKDNEMRSASESGTSNANERNMAEDLFEECIESIEAEEGDNTLDRDGVGYMEREDEQMYRYDGTNMQQSAPSDGSEPHPECCKHLPIPNQCKYDDGSCVLIELVGVSNSRVNHPTLTL
jgi:hypothetical protein